MKQTKREIRLLTGLLVVLVTVTSIFLFQAPMKQVDMANPEKMKSQMEKIATEIRLLEQQHSGLPPIKAWKKSLSTYMYQMDYELVVWNTEKKGVYYANYQEQYPIMFNTPLNHAILNKETPSSHAIQFVEYTHKGEPRFGYYLYVPQWRVYVSLTGSDNYFESPEHVLWKSVLMEVMVLLFALVLYKEITEKIYVKPLERIVAVVKQDYKIDLPSPSENQNEFELIADQLETQHEQRKNKSNAS